MAEEAVKCLNTLVEKVPIWTQDLEALLKSAAERQQQLLLENQPVAQGKPSDTSAERPRKASKASKSSSIRSRFSKKDGDEQAKFQDPPAPEAVFGQGQMPSMTRSDELRMAQRKRKTESVCSGREEGLHRYRSKGLIVVYYDGETQKQLEGIVRAIALSRNELRKGKMVARRDMTSSTKDVEPGERAEMPFRSARQTLRSATEDGTEAFDTIDRLLDKAQMQCERAAHQVLRDGDCALEIGNAKQQFSEATSLTELEVVKWKQRADEAAAKRDNEADTEGAVPQPSAELPVPEKELPPSLPASSPAALIVDDSDDDEEEEDFVLDLTKVRRSYAGRPFMLDASVKAH